MRFLREDLERMAVESAVVRQMDRQAIDDFGMPAAVLMENAGSAAAEIALEMRAQGQKCVVFAGAGNNAGDGFVVARYLANAGVKVSVITAVAPEAYRGDVRLYLRIVQRMDIPTRLWDGTPPAELAAGPFVIDALLGTGLSGPLRAPFGRMIDCLNAAGCAVLAVDVPSGLDADTGDVATTAVRAAGTVTFALPKTGLFRGLGPQLSGKVILADIGMPRAVYPGGAIQAMDR